MKFETLIVDDDALIVLVHKRFITINFHENPLIFKNGKEVLEYIQNETDLNKRYFILLDINMPEMNGWEFLDALKATPAYNQILVVIVTSSINKSDKDKAGEYMCVIDYVEKPIKVNKLIEIKERPEFNQFINRL